MNQVSDILHLAQQAQAESIDAVLATVVRTEGSAYRRAGAMMLICADGRSVGMISGGCLEPHIIKRAFWLTRSGASVQVYQTGDDDADGDNDDIIDDDLNDDELNFGLGCNGRVHVLFERLDTAQWLLSLIAQIRQTQRPAVVATLIRSAHSQHHIGMRVTIDDAITQASLADGYDDAYENHTLSPNGYTSAAFSAAQQALGRHGATVAPYGAEQDGAEQSSTVQNPTANPFDQTPINTYVIVNDEEEGKQTEWLIQRIQPQIRLLICGAGNDVAPLVSMAKCQDWHVTVIDSRPQYATAVRFADADHVSCVPLEDTQTLLALSRNAAVALMSHSLRQDRARLAVLLAHAEQCRYLGQLGPIYRTERLINEIAAAGTLSPALLASRTDRQTGVLHYPIGYKLGGDGPEALALGIMAQISAVIYDKPVYHADTVGSI